MIYVDYETINGKSCEIPTAEWGIILSYRYQNSRQWTTEK